MKLFGFGRKDKDVKFRITDEDRNWVEENFSWLIITYGLSNKLQDQIIISDKFFPKLFSTEDIQIQHIIEDLSKLLEIESEKVRFEIRTDLRDSNQMPYEIHGNPFETEIEKKDEYYTIHIAQSLSKNPNRLIFNLIYEFIKIKLIEDEVEFDTSKDTFLFLYLAGIYFNFGIPLSQNLTDQGRTDNNSWETKWSYRSEVSKELIAFSLATYSKLYNEDSPDWKTELHKESNSLFDNAIKFINQHPSIILDKNEIIALKLFEQSGQEYENKDFEKSIETLKQILSITNQDSTKTSAHNSIGYTLSRINNFEESIEHFKKATKLNPNYGHAYDNLGYSHIQLGNYQEGKKNFDLALQTGNNNVGYSHRNLGVYYSVIKEIKKSEFHFKSAFKLQTTPTDLLELHYANFLFSQGNIEKGMQYLEQSVKKGEYEGERRMEEITPSNQ
jgi:Tfp pilus assembly protein PilF